MDGRFACSPPRSVQRRSYPQKPSHATVEDIPPSPELAASAVVSMAAFRLISPDVSRAGDGRVPSPLVRRVRASQPAAFKNSRGRVSRIAGGAFSALHASSTYRAAPSRQVQNFGSCVAHMSAHLGAVRIQPLGGSARGPSEPTIACPAPFSRHARASRPRRHDSQGSWCHR